MARPRFDKSPAWRQAMSVTDALYRLTATMPDREKAGLGGLIRKTIAGLPGKVADAVGGPPESAGKPLDAAAGMLREVETMLVMGRRLKVFSGRETRKMKAAIRRLDGLMDQAQAEAATLARAAAPAPAPTHRPPPTATADPPPPPEPARPKIVIRPQRDDAPRHAAWMEDVGLNNHPKSAA